MSILEMAVYCTVDVRVILEGNSVERDVVAAASTSQGTGLVVGDSAGARTR